jgi:hypothetical protein
MIYTNWCIGGIVVSTAAFQIMLYIYNALRAFNYSNIKTSLYLGDHLN